MLSVVPPKPKLLFNMAFTFRSLATWGTRSTPAQFSLGLSRFSVGGTIWSRIANMQNMDSTAHAPPRKWPMAELVEDMEEEPIIWEERRGGKGCARRGIVGGVRKKKK